jgi:hypothetical protein
MRLHVVQFRPTLRPVANFQIVLAVDAMLTAERISAVNALAAGVIPAPAANESAAKPAANTSQGHHNSTSIS